VVRLNPDGTVDQAFATGFGFNDSVRSIAGDGSGNVYVGGDFTSYNGTGVTRLVRLHANGMVDPVLVTGVGFNDSVRSIAPAGDGSGNVYVGGDFASYNGISANGLVRLHANGTVDLTFVTGGGGGGFTGAGLKSGVRSIAPAGDVSRNLYVGGDFTNYNGTPANGLVRLHANGTVDLTFVTGAGFTGAGLNSGVRSIAPAGDGSGNVYAGGAFTSYKGTVANDLVRLDANGTVDPAFAMGTGFNDTVFSVAPAGDGSGNVYVGGSFISYNGTVANDLVRLHANGTVDPAFATGTGFNDTVFSIAPAGDGSGNVYVGGQFTTYQSLTTGRIARLKSNGSAD
jgi:beta-propeller uncharacterized protein DUF5122